jgi:hypothetical protein
MKTLKQFILTATFLSITLISSAQLHLKPKAETFLNKTADIIEEVLPSLNGTPMKRSPGYFAHSVALQRYAIRLFTDKDYLKAIYYSHYARELAFKTWAFNNKPFQSYWAMSDVDKSIVAEAPYLKELDKELKKESPGIKFVDSPYYQDTELAVIRTNEK